MRIFHDRGNARVTHQLFYGSEVNAREDKAGGKGVPKVVEPAVCNRYEPNRRTAWDRVIGHLVGIREDADDCLIVGQRHGYTTCRRCLAFRRQ